MKRGAIEKPIYVGDPVPLTREDLSRLAEGGRTPESATPKKLRESYHRVARLAASGLREYEIAEQTGYSRARIYTLMQAPAMVELIALYREKVTTEWAKDQDAYYSLATQNMIAAERHIADAIADADDRDELIPIRTALAISRDAADRFGYGKRQTNLNVNVDFAAQLEKAIKRSGKDITPVAVPASRQLADAASSPRLPTHQPAMQPRPLIRRRA